MPYINLIYDKRFAAKRELRVSQAYLYSFVGAITLSVIGYGILSFQVSSKTSTLEMLNSELQKIAPIRKEIKADKNAETALQPKLTTLKHAQDVTNSWSTVLTHLSQQTPNGVWLTEIQCNAQDPTKSVQASFIGNSVSQDQVSNYVFRLQNCTALKNVNLKFTQEKEGTDGNITNFQIDSVVKGTALDPAPKGKTSK